MNDDKFFGWFAAFAIVLYLVADRRLELLKEIKAQTTVDNN